MRQAEKALRDAREEAHKRFPEPIDAETGEPVDDWGFSECSRESFIDGAAYALSSQRTIVINDAAVEVIARHRIDKVTQGEEYTIPSKDTWLAWLRANVRDDLEAAHAAQNPEQENTE